VCRRCDRKVSLNDALDTSELRDVQSLESTLGVTDKIDFGGTSLLLNRLDKVGDLDGGLFDGFKTSNEWEPG
jgi:hypothetical protein